MSLEQRFTDRADDLRFTVDLWTEIEPHITAAAADAIQQVKWFAMDLDDYTGPSMRANLHDKFKRGELEHGRDWLDMSIEEFRQEIRDEVRDLVIYLAMRRARWVNTTDPGDEDVCGVAV